MIRLIKDYLGRRRIKGMFGTYLSPESVEKAIAAKEAPAVGPAEVELTPFFASMHDYVGLAEVVPLPLLRELLNEYFEICTKEIEREGGTLDTFVGDAVVAMFGAPIRERDHALRACVTALCCQHAVDGLRRRMGQGGGKWPERARQLRIRIGLHTGVALVGNMGTATRFNYSMVGDTVNLAARMEAGAKGNGVWTMCTAVTREACEGVEPGRVVFRRLGKIVVKGCDDLMEVFEVAALKEDATAQLLECIQIFETGLARWWAQDRDEAIAAFEKSARLERDQPGSSPEITANPSAVMLERVRAGEAKPETGPTAL